ncbi:leucine dehydrogenase [Bradyrhizobium diazoefficiens]|uniref:Glu/Leu/Phe/Val dehydrogenase family protein n=1 Tax=Bradyrhizobium diazoefficiens TaxID=1355477 RepID=UPI003516017F
MVYDHPEFDHREIHFHQDKATGLRAIVAIHTAWGTPSIGGCRMRDYSDEADALKDVLRLSRGMTYKSVMAGLQYGGAKAVIIGTPDAKHRNNVLNGMADVVNGLGGRFRTGVDVGLSTADVEMMSSRSSYVVGTGKIAPDELTADGVLVAIKTAVRFRTGLNTLAGISVCILGLGKVGGRLAQLLIDEGAAVFGADLSEKQIADARSRGVEIVSVDQALRQRCDVFAPCALGGVLNQQTIPELNCSVVAGAANNQFASDADADALAKRGILYVPDYIANSGGLIAVAAQLGAETDDWARKKVRDLEHTLLSVFEAARSDRVSPHVTAGKMADERIARLNGRARH